MPTTKKRTSTVSTPAKKKTKSLSIPRGVRSNPTGFPKQLRVVHKYYEPLVVSLAASTDSWYGSYSCNGMYDPRLAVGGHQPLYFDQMAALYNHYVVTKAKIKVEMSSSATTTQLAGGICIEDDGTISNATLAHFIERPGTVSKGFTADDGVITFRKSWDLSQNFGKGSDTASIMRGTALANPSEQQFFTIFIRSVNALEVVGVQLGITLEYEAEWRELKEPTGS